MSSLTMPGWYGWPDRVLERQPAGSYGTPDAAWFLTAADSLSGSDIQSCFEAAWHAWLTRFVICIILLFTSLPQCADNGPDVIPSCIHQTHAAP